MFRAMIAAVILAAASMSAGAADNGFYIGAAVGDIVFVAGRRHLGSALSG